MAYTNRLFCRTMFGVKPLSWSPVPAKGPVLLAANHSSYADPLILSATAGRPITYVVASDLYDNAALRWLFEHLDYIPVTRGRNTTVAVRAIERALGLSKVVGIFPEGGIDECRKPRGYHGVGYFALKLGVPVVPAAIVWHESPRSTLLQSLTTPRKASVRYGHPILVDRDPGVPRKRLQDTTTLIMEAIHKQAKDAGLLVCGRSHPPCRG